MNAVYRVTELYALFYIIPSVALDILNAVYALRTRLSRLELEDLGLI